jgi:L,D-transpeptidase YcbB
LYAGTIVDGVMAFQLEHGLAADGILGPLTMAALQVPMGDRVRQIEITLERWRWLPDRPPPRYLVVNVPEFRLYAFEDDSAARHPVFTMSVIVGRSSARRGTPLFASTVDEVVFRPYWDVPPRIAQSELLPDFRRQPDSLAREGYEIVQGSENDAVIYPPTGATLDGLANGSLRVRQRPGPANALGLVKFVFPNRHNVYLHGTPEQELFARPRRDFSHGCIRAEDPTTVAEFALRGQAEWDRTAILAAMQREETRHVPIERPIAIYILYATVVPGDGESAAFYPDIYRYDAAVEKALNVPGPSRSISSIGLAAPASATR